MVATGPIDTDKGWLEISAREAEGRGGSHMIRDKCNVSFVDFVWRVESQIRVVKMTLGI